MLQRHGVQTDVVSVPSHKNAFTVKTAKCSAVVRALPACLAYFSSQGDRAQQYANPNPAPCEVLSSDGCTGEVLARGHVPSRHWAARGPPKCPKGQGTAQGSTTVTRVGQFTPAGRWERQGPDPLQHNSSQVRRWRRAVETSSRLPPPSKAPQVP